MAPPDLTSATFARLCFSQCYVGISEDSGGFELSDYPSNRLSLLQVVDSFSQHPPDALQGFRLFRWWFVAGRSLSSLMATSRSPIRATPSTVYLHRHRREPTGS